MNGDVKRHHPFQATIARLLSEYWVSGLYESFRLLLDRELLTPSEQEPFKAIFADLDPIRMTIDKHEIAKARKFSAPIELVRTPSKGTEDVLEYDPKDKRGKSHIAPVALFPNGSLGCV
jgi:hypothetical protein